MIADQPRPVGTPVRGSATGRPIMAVLDLLGRRWTLRILWELRDAGPTGFRDLQRTCGNMSSSVLSTRLEELTDAALLVARENGYELTAIGRELVEVLLPLHTWSERWAAPSSLDSRS